MIILELLFKITHKHQLQRVFIMKKLLLTFAFAIVTSGAMFISAEDAQAWWDDDDYWDRPWYGGGAPWYGGYPYGGYGGYPYGGYPNGGYGGYPYGGYGGYPYGGYPQAGYADPAATTDTTTPAESTTTAPAYPAYPTYYGY